MLTKMDQDKQVIKVITGMNLLSSDNTITKFENVGWSFYKSTDADISNGNLQFTDLTAQLTSPITKISL